jgi:hypothetical protein
MLSLSTLATTDTVARVAVVEGYNSNTYQAQDDPNVPVIVRHPSPFTGVDANLELRFLGRDADRVTLIAGGRANHYEPLQPESQSDDGAVNLAFGAHLALAPRATLVLSESGSVTSFNASHVTDGTIFAFDPTRLRSTYYINDVGAAVAFQLSPNWRYTQSFSTIVSGTIASSPTQTETGQIVEHRGLDYVTPSLEGDLERDFSARNSGDLMALYQYAYNLYVLDFTQRIPRNIGPDKQAYLTLLAGWTRHETPELSTVLRAGAVVGSAPPRDIDQRPILAPAAMGEIYYSRPFFDLVGSAGYSWGTVNPRLGSGPTASGGVLAVGIPRHVGAWKNLAFIGRAQGSFSSLITGVDQSTSLGLFAAGFEARYGLNNWLGILAGYSLRYAWFNTPDFSPPFAQQIFFVGASGYWSTDPTQLPLTTFGAPIEPPS